MNYSCDVLYKFVLNYELLERYKLSLSDVAIKSFVVKDRPNQDGVHWSYVLTVNMTSCTDDSYENYEVDWQFSDKWGNCAFYQLTGPEIQGDLKIIPVDYDDFMVGIFRITKVGRRSEVIFEFDQPDEIAIVRVEKIDNDCLMMEDEENLFDDSVDLSDSDKVEYDYLNFSERALDRADEDEF